MSYQSENDDVTTGVAAELTGSVGMDGVGNDMPDNVADDIADLEQHLAERDIPVSDDVQDTEAAAEEREVEAEQAQQRGKKVPLAALHEERQKRQALELQVQAQAQQLQQFMAQQQAIQQAQLQQQQEAAIPDFDEDPRGYIEAKERQFVQQLEQLKGQGQQPQHQQQVQAIEQQVMREAQILAPAISEAEARFEATTPDYRQAFDHVLATVEQNMRAQHPGINEHQLGMLRTAAILQVAKQCQSNGQDVAAFVYQRAQAMGYQPASRAPRREAPTSLSNLQGSSRAPDERGSLKASQISDMSEADFDRLWKDMARDGAQRPKV